MTQERGFLKQLPHLFERFYRVRGARGRSVEGSGIGLTLVQELVKLHGGHIHVESKLKQGSVFRVSKLFRSTGRFGDSIGRQPNLWPESQRSTDTIDLPSAKQMPFVR